jgi:hypothetical protein
MDGWLPITNIQFVRHGDFYDLHVPGSEHYLANGIYHHNSGKTRAGTVEVLRQPPGSTGAVVCPTYKMLKDTIIPTIRETAKDLLVSFNKSDMVMEFIHGITLLLRSSDDPESLRGPNLGFFWMDEPALQTHMTWKIMLGRIRRAPGRAWVTGTPAGRNWLYKVFVLDAGDDYELITASSHDNPWLPKHYLETLDGTYEGAFHKQEVSGEFVEWVEEPAYPGFQENRNCVDDLFSQYNEWLPLVLCCDFNHRIMSWPVCQIIDGQPRVLTEITKHKVLVPDMVVEFRKEFPDHRAGLWIYGDASGGSGSATAASAFDQIFDGLSTYPSDVVFMVPKSNPPVLDRIRAVNDVLRGTNGYLLTIDSKRCKVLKDDFEKVEMNKTGTNVEKIEDPNEEKSLLTHSSDAIGYWLNMEFPVGVTRRNPHEAEMGADGPRKKQKTPDMYIRKKKKTRNGGLLRGL